MIFANSGFLGIPLASAVFGSNSPIVIHIILLNILSNILMFTVGVYLISGDAGHVRIKNALLNPVLLAFILGIALNLCTLIVNKPIGVKYYLNTLHCSRCNAFLCPAVHNSIII